MASSAVISLSRFSLRNFLPPPPLLHCHTGRGTKELGKGGRGRGERKGALRKEEEDCLRRHGGIAIFSLVVNFGNLICIKSPPFRLKAAPKRKFRFPGRGYCPAEARLERGKLNFLGHFRAGKIRRLGIDRPGMRAHFFPPPFVPLNPRILLRKNFSERDKLCSSHSRGFGKVKYCPPYPKSIPSSILSWGLPKKRWAGRWVGARPHLSRSPLFGQAGMAYTGVYSLSFLLRP